MRLRRSKRPSTNEITEYPSCHAMVWITNHENVGEALGDLTPTSKQMRLRVTAELT